MEFLLSEKHILARKLYESFAKDFVKDLAAEVDEEERFPVETVERMKEYGFFGIPFSKELGGMGGDNLSYAMCVETMSKYCATTGVIISAHSSLGAWPIYEFGTPEQKEKYIADMSSGKRLGAFGLTEPNAGTDAAMQQTTAIDKGDHFEISGSKIFITNAGYADVYVVFAMTDREKGLKGISAFIMEADMEGFTIGKKEKKLGIKGSATCELIFDKVKVPKENLLGKIGEGFKIAMKTLDGGRIGIASQALGIAQGALDEAVQYVKERKQFGRPISKFQDIQFKLAKMKTDIEAARLLVYSAAIKKDNNKPYSNDAAMAKLFAAEVAMDVTTKAVQIFGGYGYTREYPVERMMRDAKITEIYEGTSEVQKMVIAAHLLK